MKMPTPYRLKKSFIDVLRSPKSLLIIVIKASLALLPSVKIW